MVRSKLLLVLFSLSNLRLVRIKTIFSFSAREYLSSLSYRKEQEVSMFWVKMRESLQGHDNWCCQSSVELFDLACSEGGLVSPTLVCQQINLSELSWAELTRSVSNIVSWLGVVLVTSHHGRGAGAEWEVLGNRSRAGGHHLQGSSLSHHHRD